MNELLRFSSPAGIDYRIEETAEGDLVQHTTFDAEAILDRNKAMATHNDGYSPSRELRRAASIPLTLVYKWLNEEGWNALDHRYADKLRQKLNDPDYLYLRTAPGRL